MTYIEYDGVFVLQGIDDLSESDKLTVAQSWTNNSRRRFIEII